MGRVIAVANQKGGVGKTTTAVNVSAWLARLGKRALLIDADPQGNSTSGLGIDKKGLSTSVYDALIDDLPLREVVVSTSIPGLDLAPSNIDLAGAEIELVSQISREAKLKKSVAPEAERYDYILIDCPPSLGLLTVNALVAAETVLVPIQCEYYALEGVSQLLSTVNLVKNSLNPSLSLEGVVLTMFDARTNLSIQVVDEVKKHFRGKVFRSIVPRNVRLSEAPSHGVPIFVYDPKSRGAEVYEELAREVIENG